MNGDDAIIISSNPKSILPKSMCSTAFLSSESGYVNMIDSMILAEVARKHGAGRFSLEDKIISEIGFEVLVEQGQQIQQGEEWLLFHHNQELSDEDFSRLNDSISLQVQKVGNYSRLIKTIY